MSAGLELSNEGRIILWRPLEPLPMIVGRNPECDLCFPDNQVAPVQFLIRRERDAFILCNRNHGGTVISGVRVDVDHVLREGDVVELGPVRAVFRAQAQRGDAPGTQTLGREARPRARFWLSTSLGASGQVWRIDGRGLSVGSDPGCDVVIEDPYVSRFHAHVTLQEGRCVVRDLGSRNGVFLGEQKVGEAELPPEATLRIGRAILHVRQEPQDAPGVDAPNGSARMVGDSPAMARVAELIDRMGPTDAPVLITGETGTGKEVVARALVNASKRAKGPYLTLNCGALGKGLIESELFGHEKGAFTGAVARKAGAFELTDGGTLFLDELGELPIDLQASLLRVAEYGEYRRVGGQGTLTANVRLITATNRDLAEEVRTGRFREDLLHRLNVLTIELPPLRMRMQDLPQLTRYFMASFAPQGERLTLGDDALEKLMAYDWPGNVRELRNAVQRAVLMRRSSTLTAEDITLSQASLQERVEARQALTGRTLIEIECEAIRAELARHNGNKTKAAEALGVSRSTIHRKIEEYGIGS